MKFGTLATYRTKDALSNDIKIISIEYVAFSIKVKVKMCFNK